MPTKPSPITDYMRTLARKGGASKSESKTRAARENGRKGGRPRKQKETP